MVVCVLYMLYCHTFWGTCGEWHFLICSNLLFHKVVNFKGCNMNIKIQKLTDIAVLYEYADCMRYFLVGIILCLVINICLL